MLHNIQLIGIPALSFVFLLVITPFLSKAAGLIQLVDRPGTRKVHTGAIPLIGGIGIWLASTATLLIAVSQIQDFKAIKAIWVSASILLLMGVLDDKMDIRASLKLAVQILLAHFVFTNGIRIESLYGIFNIGELPIYIQYFLTIIVVTGVVNAFNLMDGIDGLAAGLAVLAFIVLTGLAFMLGKNTLVIIYLSITGALLGFLRFNLSRTQKIFMGDAGALFLGFILVSSAILLLQSARAISETRLTFAAVMGILCLPVLDSLRVYRKRIKAGKSPFQADKTHLHHLVLALGLRHKSASGIIVFSAFVLLLISLGTAFYCSPTLIIVMVLFVFWALTSVLEINNNILHWKTRIREMEG